jgi:flagellar biosynthesis protein FlhF
MVAAAGWRGLVGCREVEIVAATERTVSESRRSESVERQSHADHVATDLAARLTAGGLDPAIAAEVVDSIPVGRRRGGALARQLSALASPDEDYARVEVFVGPPGAGKTTTIAKIAAQERARCGRSLGLIAADGFRVGAVEQLRIYAEVLRSPFRVVRSGEDLEAALKGRRRQPVLVDTAGRAPTDAAAAELFDVLAGRSDVRTHLVMPAGTPVRAARRLFDAYEKARPSRLVLTKLDEAESLSPLVSLLRERELPISYLGTGQHVPEDLTRATAPSLAASVLGDVPTSGAVHS